MTLFGREQGITTFPEFDRETFVFENYAHATSLIRASLFENVKYDDRFQTGWEDWDVYLGFIELGYHGKLVDAPLLRYRKHVDLKSQTDGLKDDIKINQLRIAVMANHRRLYRTWEYRCHQVRTKVLLLKLTLTHRYASRWPSFHQ